MPFAEIDLPPVLEQTVWGQTVFQWLVAAGIFLLVLLVLPATVRFVAKRIRQLTTRSRTRWDDVAVESLQRTRGFFYLALAVYCAALVLDLPDRGRRALRVAVVLVSLLQVGLWFGFFVKRGIQSVADERAEKDPASATGLTAINMLSQVLVWVAVLLMALDNMGVDVTAFVAGLGVAGIAIGLAVQNILGDLFASISIVLDKPFEVGDFIIVGDMMGTVEKVGLKTTRVRSLGGEQLVFSNQDLLGSRVRNYKRMAERRVVFSFGVLYSTSLDALRQIPEWVRGIVEGVEQTRFDRAHFKAFGASSLDFEVVYYVLAPEYNLYMDIQQTINLALATRFREAGVDFAFPTRTLHVYAGDGSGADDAFPALLVGGDAQGRQQTVDSA